MNEQRRLHPVDRKSVVIAASMMIGINQLIINVQPLLLGALAQSRGFDDAQLGLVSSAMVGGVLVASSSAPLWVRRVGWRMCTVAAVLCAVMLLGATAMVRGFAVLCACFALLGLAKGVIGAPSFVCLGDSSNPERNFGTSVVIQAIVAALAAAPMAGYLIPAFGLNGVLCSLAAILLAGLVAVAFLPDAGREPEQAAGPTGSSAAGSLVPFILVMLAYFIFTVGLTSFWFFLERIGTSQAIPASTIGLAVSGTALVTIPGSSAVVWLSRWLSGLHFALAGSVLIVCGYAVVALSSPAAFLAGSLTFAFGWGIAQPGYWALARETDPTSRLFVLSSATAGFAAMTTGILAGPVIAAGGYNGLMAMAGLLVLAGMLMCAAAWRIARHAPRPAQG